MSEFPVVSLITATCGRATCLQRVMKFIENQDYEGKYYHIIYNNSSTLQTLDPNTPSNVILINNHISKRTGEQYTNLGDIYNDILDYIPEDTEIINFVDDDDIFLPNHISEGIRGLHRTNKRGYKPKYSYYRHSNGIELVENTLEPSIFLYYDVLKEVGFSLETTPQHLTWVNHLVYNNDIFVDAEGIPTLVYNWGDHNIPTFKTSGNAGHPDNFNNYRSFSQDNGSGVLKALDNVEEYYNELTTLNK